MDPHEDLSRKLRSLDLAIMDPKKLVPGRPINPTAPDSVLRILHLARDGKAQETLEAIHEEADKQGVPTTDVIRSIRDSENRTIAHYCADGGSHSCCDTLTLCLAEFKDDQKELKSEFLDTPGIMGKGKTAFIDAACVSNLPLMTLLKEHGANVDARTASGKNAYFDVAANLAFPSICFLDEIGVPINATDHHGYTPLHMATNFENNGDIVLNLIRHDAEPDVSTSVGAVSPAHFAAQLQDKGCLTYLALEGADLEVTDRKGTTTVHYAVRMGSVKCLEFLYQSGVSLNSQDTHGFTPLHYATLADDDETMLKKLLELRANPEISDKVGRRPIHIACAGPPESPRYLAMIRELHRRGADVNSKNSEGFTPVQIAYRNRNSDVVRYLCEEAGASLDGLKDANPMPDHPMAMDTDFPLDIFELFQFLRSSHRKSNKPRRTL